MKTKTNRYRDPRIRYELDDWTRKKVTGGATPQFGTQAKGFGKKKKGKS